MPAFNVLADAQFGLVRILRPFLEFETVYSGQSVDTPIALSRVLRNTGGDPRDPLAADQRPGYDPNLIRGLSMPVGARVALYMPKILAGGAERYRYRFIWRLRNTLDYRLGRIPYHYPKQGEGVPDSTDTPPSARVVIPAAEQTILYAETPEPAGPVATVVTSSRVEDVTFGGTSLAAPLLPGGVTGVVQQGILDPGNVVIGDDALLPTYALYETQAWGDELLVMLYRTDTLGANWDFSSPGGVDEQLSLLLGGGGSQPFPAFPDVGVYVLVGSAP